MISNMSHARSTIPASPVYHKVLPKRPNVQENIYSLNQMILNLFTRVLLTYAASFYILKKHVRDLMRLHTCQFNKFLPIIYNTRVVFLHSLKEPA